MVGVDDGTECGILHTKSVGLGPPAGSVAEFSMALRRGFGDRFLGYLMLTYLGLKGVTLTVVQAATLPYFQSMGVSGNDFQLATVVAMIPWSMKGLVGVMSDCFPIGPYHKRGYLLASSFVGLTGLVALAWLPPQDLGGSAIWGVATLFCLANAMLSTFDLLCEGKYAELMREEGAGSEVLTLVWTCVQLGSLIGSLAVAAFVDARGPRPMLAACLPLVFFAVWRTCRGDMPEKRARSWASLRLKAFSEPRLFLLAILMALGGLALALSAALLETKGRATVAVGVSVVLVFYSFLALPRTLAKSNFYMFLVSVAYIDVSGPLSYFYTGSSSCIVDGPHFSYSYYLAISQMVGAASAALGAVVFQCVQHWQFRHVFCITTIAQVVASMFDVLIIERVNLSMGLSDQAAYLFGDAACQKMAAQMAIMPCAVLSARLCPREAESTVFAIMAGFQNFGFAIGSIFGVQMADQFGVQASMDGPCEFGGLSLLVIVAHVVVPLACLPLAWVLIPAARIDDEVAFDVLSPAPSFSSPGPSPRSSPASSPRSYNEAILGTVEDEYHLMVHEGSSGGLRRQFSS